MLLFTHYIIELWYSLTKDLQKSQNVNGFRLELHHFRGKCSWGLLSLVIQRKPPTQKVPLPLIARVRRASEGKDHSVLASFLTLGVCYWKAMVGLLVWYIAVVLIIFVFCFVIQWNYYTLTVQILSWYKLTSVRDPLNLSLTKTRGSALLETEERLQNAGGGKKEP